MTEWLPERGLGKLLQLIRCRSLMWNRSRIWHLYCLMQLNHRRRGKRRIPNPHPLPLISRGQINTVGRYAQWDGTVFLHSTSL